MVEDRGELKVGEHHPSYNDAVNYISRLGYTKLLLYLEAFSSCAIEGNRIGEVCGTTLKKILDNELVGERYVLGLAWQIRRMEEQEKNSSEIS